MTIQKVTRAQIALIRDLARERNMLNDASVGIALRGGGMTSVEASRLIEWLKTQPRQLREP